MKHAVLLLSFLCLSAILAAAQTPQKSFASPSGKQGSETSQSSPDNDLRGCLTGTQGNYTLVDHQGKAHKVTGDNHLLWEDTGHEVDMTGNPGSNHTFQETQVLDIASRCWNFKP